MMNALDPGGPQAAHIAQLWWLMLVVCGVVLVAVLGALVVALLRAPRGDVAMPPDIAPASRRERKARWSIGVAIGVSALALSGLLVASIRTDHALAQLSLRDAVTVHVTAHQWWWEVRYDDPQPGRMFTTANELYVPVGRPVVVTLEASDVIHSFWVPSLHGKKDLIPGRTATIQFRADKPGPYQGLCAEFCGLQHAYMAFDVVAVPPERFEAWADAQRKPAPEPATAAAKRGRELVETGSCMLCHTIQGTSAQGRVAPDLTHIASRAHLGAGIVRNTPEALAAWITDAQKIKAGVNMPAHLLPPEDLGALVAYLQTLQ